MTYSDETDYRAGCFRKLNTYFKLLWYTHFYTRNTYLPTYIRSRGWSVVVSTMDTSAATADTIQRVDFDFVTPKSGAGKVYALDSTAFYLNYYLGHCPQGVTGVHANTGLLDKKVYTNMDVFYSGNNKGMRMQAAFGAGSNPYFELEVSGADTVIVLDSNWVEVHTIQGIQYYRALAYQTNGTILDSLAIIWEEGRLKFDVDGSYDNTLGVIWQWDWGGGLSQSFPFNDNLSWSSYYSGGNDVFFDSEIDNRGQLHLCGRTNSKFFPMVLGAEVYQDSLSVLNSQDVIIVKFKPSGKESSSTYYGGSQGNLNFSLGYDQGNGIEIDEKGNVFVTGYTGSTNFPTFRPSDLAYYQSADSASEDNYNLFIIKLDSTLQTQKWATIFGDGGDQSGSEVAVDSKGNIYVVGASDSLFQIYFDPGGESFFSDSGTGILLEFDSVYQPIWITNVSQNISYYAFLSDVAIDGNDNVIVTGSVNGNSILINNPGGNSTHISQFDAIVMKFNGITKDVDWSSYFGGNYDDYGTSIKEVDRKIYVVGRTLSSTFTNFFKTEGSLSYMDSIANGSDIFILKLDNITGTRDWGTLYGGNENELSPSIAVDNRGNIFVGSFSLSSNLILPDFENYYHDVSIDISNHFDGFIAGFNGNLELKWGTYFGGEIDDDVINTILTYMDTSLFIAGGTKCGIASDFPFRDGLGVPYFQDLVPIQDGTKAFVARFNISSGLTGIDNFPIPSNKKSAIYPNPSSEIVNLWVVDKVDKADIKICDLLGNVILNITTKLPTDINVMDFPSGAYVITIQTRDSTYFEKLIKQ